MAYMSQEHKKRINVELKKVLPKDWRWSLSVKHHMSIVLTIWQGPAEIMIDGEGKTYEDQRSPNEYYLAEAFQDKRIGRFFVEVKKALDLDNFDNSDTMTDYFHVGHYVDIKFGRYDKAYIIDEKASKPWETAEPVKAETDPDPIVESFEDFVNSITEETADPDPVDEPVEAEPVAKPKQAKKRSRKPAAKKQQPKQTKTARGIIKAAAVEVLTLWLAKLQS